MTTVTVMVYNIKQAIDQAVLTFGPTDAVCSLGDAYCPLPDLTAWLATLPAAQSAQHRYVIGIGKITENTTGKNRQPLRHSGDDRTRSGPVALW